jgi:hypothetical protein
VAPDQPPSRTLNSALPFGLVPEVDLLDLLTVDHQRLLSAGSRSIVAETAQHLSVERDLLYPAVRDYVEGAENLLERFRASERPVEERLSAFERDPTPEARLALETSIREHAKRLESVFPALREQIPQDVLDELTETVPLAIGSAPTYAHQNLAEGGIVGELAEDLDSVADHLRDRIHARRQSRESKP